MDKYAEIIRKGYNQLASAFDNWAEEVRTEERRKYLTKIDQSFASGSRILDIGCGNGLLNTRHFANRFDVIGLDVSERQINEAKSNLPNVRFICADVREYEFEPSSLDGIVSFYCFNHIPRTSYELLFNKFHHWLRIDGLLIASFGVGDTKEWIGEWLGATMFFSSYNQRETLSLIEQNGFKIEEETVETALENGTEVSFLWIIARNKKL
jgi:cyclopropane fatty-acyl-phospholipid synthase-like methyltransferase